jgi:hypothetical protein
MARIRWSPLVQAALAAAALLPFLPATAQVTPGSSGATTSSSDQTLVISGSNTSINGSTGQATSPEPLGFFASGNSVFQQSGNNSR